MGRAGLAVACLLGFLDESYAFPGMWAAPCLRVTRSQASPSVSRCSMKVRSAPVYPSSLHGPPKAGPKSGKDCISRHMLRLGHTESVLI